MKPARRPTTQELQKHTALNQAKFDAWSATYEDKRFDFFRRMQERLLSQLGIAEGSAFLDVGCGTGWAVRRATGMVGKKGAACGIDLSQGMIDKAKAAARGIANARFVQANAEKIPFKDAFFDRVICTMSFHHYLHPAVVMKEISRVLKPGGTVCIVDPTSDSFFVTWVDAITKKRQPDHVKLYSSREFQDLFHVSGLEYAGSRRIMPLWLTAKGHFAAKPAVARPSRTTTGGRTAKKPKR